MGFFKKTPKVKAEPASPFIECRSWGGYAFHIRDVRDESGLALCLYDPLDDASVLTPERFALSMENQHENFFYCRECVIAYTEATADER